MTFRTYTLGEIFYIENGYAFKSSEFKATGTPVIKIKNIKAGHFKDDEFSYVESIFLKLKPNKVTRPDDLLISMSGNRHDGNPDTWVGKVCRFNKNEKMLINQRVGALRFRSPTLACANYMGYLLSQMLYQEYFISIATSSGGQANLSPNQILSMEVTLPTISKQSAIASILGSLDDKIELNRRTNETLEAMARALFRDWFVDFGPTRTKMAGEAPYLAPELWELFPDRLDDEGKPEGWLDGTLEDIANLQNGYAFKSSDWLVDGIPVVKIGAVKPSVVDLKNVSFVDSKFLKEKPNFILKSGDILIGLTGYVGEVGRVPPSQLTPMLNQRVARFLPEASFYAYIFCIGRQKEFKEFVENQAHGSAQANVSTKDVLTYPIVIPTMNLSAFFDENVGLILEKFDENLSEIDTLTQLRDLLLPKLMSGEISIRDAEKMVEDVA